MALNSGRVVRLMVSPFRHPKTGVFYFRQAVPAALREAVGNATDKPGRAVTELKWSLKTKDAKEARRLMPAALQLAQDILEAARGNAVPLTHIEQHALAGLFYRHLLTTWQRDLQDFYGWEAGVKVWDREHGSSSLIPEFMVREFLASHNTITTSETVRELHALFAQRMVQAVTQFNRLQKGDYSADKRLSEFPEWSAPARQGPAKSKTTLSDLLTQRKAIGAIKPRTVTSTEYTVRSLIKFLGHEDATRIRREDMLAWRDDQKKQGLSNQTINNNFSLLGKMFAQAASDGLLKDGLLHNVRLPTGFHIAALWPPLTVTKPLDRPRDKSAPRMIPVSLTIPGTALLPKGRVLSGDEFSFALSRSETSSTSACAPGVTGPLTREM